MDSNIYNLYMDKIINKLKCIDNYSCSEINNYLDYMCEMANIEIKNIKCDDELLAIEISKIGSALFGLMAICIEYINIESEKYNEVYGTLLTTISNNCISVVKLIIDGFDYQVGILLRSTYELVFTLIAIVIDKQSCEMYMSADNNGNTDQIWYKYFRIKNLNKIISSFEKDIDDNLIFLKDWRESNYKLYSEYIHNHYSVCWYNCYGEPNINKQKTVEYNLWGMKATRIRQHLPKLNDLMLWGSSYFFFLMAKKQSDKRELVLSIPKEKKEIMELILILKELLKELSLKYKKEYDEE